MTETHPNPNHKNQIRTISTIQNNGLPVLEGKDITYQYPKTKSYVFKKFNFKITGPGFHSLFGPSGIGKTTIAKMIAGETIGFSGKIRLEKIKNVLYSYNLEKLPGFLNLNQHFLEITPKTEIDKITPLVDTFGLQDHLKNRFNKLSLGQQNRANLARYLLQKFDLLIMDESLANVDEITREQIILKIKKMFPNKCFLYISHNVLEVAKFCKQILIFRTPLKKPEAVTLKGLNYQEGQSIKQKKLEETMLEIVNAS